jgi:hypothetical protein
MGPNLDWECPDAPGAWPPGSRRMALPSGGGLGALRPDGSRHMATGVSLPFGAALNSVAVPAHRPLPISAGVGLPTGDPGEGEQAALGARPSRTALVEEQDVPAFAEAAPVRPKVTSPLMSWAAIHITIIKRVASLRCQLDSFPNAPRDRPRPKRQSPAHSDRTAHLTPRQSCRTIGAGIAEDDPRLAGVLRGLVTPAWAGLSSLTCTMRREASPVRRPQFEARLRGSRGGDFTRNLQLRIYA